MKPLIFLRSAYNYDTKEASVASGLSCSDPTRTQQQFADECDINTIVRNFGVTGFLPQTAQSPMQGDFTGVVDYQSALNLILQADEAFSQVPAAVRKEFNNDPQLYLDFVSDPANLPKMREMGLARPETAPPAPLEVRVIPEPTPEPPAAPAPSKQSSTKSTGA